MWKKFTGWAIMGGKNEPQCQWNVSWQKLNSRAMFSPEKNGAKHLLNGNGDALNTLFWWHKCCNYGSWEGHSEPNEIGVNTCLILQHTLYVTVTALAVQNKREHPNRVKGFVETVVPNYCFSFSFQHVHKHFSWRILHFFPPRLCYDLYDLIIFIVSIRRIIIADHCCCAMIL